MSCRAGLEVRVDCQAEGKGGMASDGQAICVFDETCQVDRCVGDVIEVCSLGRVGQRERCSKLVPGTTCVSPSGLTECRAPVPAPECLDDTDFASWCEGSQAVTCFGGVRTEVECGALARGVCQSGFRGDGAIATCVADLTF